MGELSEQKIAMLRGLVSASPDEVVRGLERAVCTEGGSGPLAAIGALVEAEAADRTLRFTVMAPVATLFGPVSPDGRPTFPRIALKLIWNALKSDRPDWVRAAAAALQYYDPDEAVPEIFDKLCLEAAEGLRAGENDNYLAAAAACEAARPGGAEMLILCLELAPIVRPAMQRLGEWLQRMTEERRATARLAYRDATAKGEAGGPLFFEMLAGHLPQPWTILRIISAVMDHPSERYLASSEVAAFGVRTLDGVEALLERVKALRVGANVEAGRAAARAVLQSVEAMAELEQSVQLSKDGPWGVRLGKLKQALAMAVESRLREIDEAVLRALPMQTLRYSGRLVKNAPRLDTLPNDAAVEWAICLLTLADGVRSCASEAGFGSVRGKILDNLSKHLDQYVEDVLEQIRLGDIKSDDNTRAHLEVAARILGLARDESSASIVRRRAAAA